MDGGTGGDAGAVVGAGELPLQAALGAQVPGAGAQAQAVAAGGQQQRLLQADAADVAAQEGQAQGVAAAGGVDAAGDHAVGAAQAPVEAVRADGGGEIAVVEQRQAGGLLAQAAHPVGVGGAPAAAGEHAVDPAADVGLREDAVGAQGGVQVVGGGGVFGTQGGAQDGGAPARVFGEVGGEDIGEAGVGGELHGQRQGLLAAFRGDGEQGVQVGHGGVEVADLQVMGGEPGAHVDVAGGAAGGDVVHRHGFRRGIAGVGEGRGEDGEGAAVAGVPGQDVAGDGGGVFVAALLEVGAGFGQLGVGVGQAVAGEDAPPCPGQQRDDRQEDGPARGAHADGSRAR